VAEVDTYPDRAGTHGPIDYFHVPPWDPDQCAHLDFSAYSFSQPLPLPTIVEEQASPPAPSRATWRQRLASFLKEEPVCSTGTASGGWRRSASISR